MIESFGSESRRKVEVVYRHVWMSFSGTQATTNRGKEPTVNRTPRPLIFLTATQLLVLFSQGQQFFDSSAGLKIVGTAGP